MVLVDEPAERLLLRRALELRIAGLHLVGRHTFGGILRRHKHRTLHRLALPMSEPSPPSRMVTAVGASMVAGVTVTAEPMPAMTGHHRTGIVLVVKRVTAISNWSW